MPGRLLARVLIASGQRAERLGRVAAACGRYRLAARFAPRSAGPHLNLGAALEILGDTLGAGQAYQAALAAEPGNAHAHFNLGRLHHARGEHAAAERALGAALERKPEFADARIALGNTLEAKGDLPGAMRAVAQALELDPRHAGAWYNQGHLLLKLERFDAAEDALRRALELEPRFILAHHLLFTLLRMNGRLPEATQVLAAARQLAPERFDLESMELLALTLSDTLLAQELFSRQRAFGARLEAAVAPPAAVEVQGADPERRLRVGYVSCDFNRHPVGWFMLPLLERHDRARIEPICYSTAIRPADAMTGRLRAAAGQWREASALDDGALAAQVRRDAIDILVDLTGHAGLMRLGVFALQPAPVQASWLGYLGSTGLSRIQYRLTDALADPPGVADRLHTEQLVRLPHSQWCYRPVHGEPHAAEPPSARNGYITFGSFNHLPKLSATSRRSWAQLLLRLPRSRLVLLGVPEGRARERLLQDFTAAGVAATRLDILPRVPVEDYARQFDGVDIALDSMPYGGGTTTFDALWMGVPVLACTGTRSVERSAASILGALGLQDWIADSSEDYLRRALALAADGARLAQLRATLRERLRASPLMDEAGFARDMEDAYRSLWRAWCAGRLA